MNYKDVRYINCSIKNKKLFKIVIEKYKVYV